MNVYQREGSGTGDDENFHCIVNVLLDFSVFFDFSTLNILTLKITVIKGGKKKKT